ncbi:MAG: DUF4982 domain-containing protein [Clostridia bacterium]|nr:DUF4982 domain-containing protein [Clostridia bacterium]
MRKLMNDGWLFAKLPAGSTLEDAEKAEFVPVDLPHDWLIWQTDLYETADAWYRRELELPEEHEPVVLVRFDGVYMDCDVLLNGEIIRTHRYGYTAFDVPLTGKLKAGRNILLVHIRHLSPNTRWYSGSGIYRDVYLETLPENHLVPGSLYLKEEENDGKWQLKIAAQAEGTGKDAFECILLDRDDRRVACAEGSFEGQNVTAFMEIPEARTWSPEDPYLYKLYIRYGKQTEVRKIGLRSVFADPDRGLFLNGQPVKLRGVCLHHDLGALGAAFHKQAAARQLQLMKEMGANAVRTSHNPPASDFLDLCDEMGILVIDEAFDMWERPKTDYDYARFFDACFTEDVASWIRRDRCHPCVIMWSIGNEIYDMHADSRGTELTKILNDQVRLHDPLCRALTTFGCNYMPWQGGQRCAEHVDAVGYNYGERLYEKHHAEHPGWVIYGSETGSVLSSRGIYHFPAGQSIMCEADSQCSALGNSNTSWGADSLKRILATDMQLTYSLGQFLWSGIDYIGEPTPYHTRSCYFGQADTACFPKDPYYLVQSYWTKKKMIHIGVSWDWNRGQITDVPVMTNCSEAELFLDGQSLGRKQNNLYDGERFPLLWQIPFRPGTLCAKGYDEAGRMICEDYRYTPGETAYLKLSCENESMLSDGRDLIFVTVSAEDRNHHPVENARNRIRATVTGGGRLIGTDNGDSTDTDSYKCDSRRLFSGKLLLIIASNGKREDVHIRVEGNDCNAGELTVPARNAEIISGISCTQEVYSQPLPEAVSVRRIDLAPLDSTALTPEHDCCVFRFSVLPENAAPEIQWQATNASGIESPCVKLEQEKNTVTVRAGGDGNYYLRALCRENGQCVLISQTEFSAGGFGNPAYDPYRYVSAGLYDLHEGEIGAGNEKGIAFARDGESMIGFRQVDFGKTGSDRITVDIFALDSNPYDIELFTMKNNGEERRIGTLHYEKPSIWNVYQPETWTLKERLTGIHTLCFRMRDKVHMKGFVFETQQRAYFRHPAASADRIYGDSFMIRGNAVAGIGNNVTLTWEEMDFGGVGNVLLEIEGETPLEINAVTVRIRNEKGEEITGIADFAGRGARSQQFPVQVPAGVCSVSFVFLPGSNFDFEGFRFSENRIWTEEKE